MNLINEVGALVKGTPDNSHTHFLPLEDARRQTSTTLKRAPPRAQPCRHPHPRLLDSRKVRNRFIPFKGQCLAAVMD